MKKAITVVIAVILVSATCYGGEFNVKEGDVVFQSFPSSQTRAIQLATKSRYSHVGMILRHHGRLMVCEAVGPVKFTSLDSWIGRNGKRHFTVRRLRNADSVLTGANLARVRTAALEFEGRPYDFVFSWSDDKLYCSELVWKVFHRALSIDIGQLRRMREFDLSAPEVREILRERYPAGPPLEETVVSPEDLLRSPALVTVFEH